METVATGYVFPNDLHIHWSLMIALYPYITGLVAGAFIVSSLYHVFGMESLKPVSRFSLIASLAFLAVATFPLLLHLGVPANSFKIMITPNMSSAMAGFGFFYSGYMLILLLEVWLVFRKDIVTYAQRSRGLKQLMYKVLALGVYDISEKALRIDKKAVTVLAAIGIPGAFLLHGYVGFLFGAIKANPFWSTPLMPIIFIFSAVVSGIAVIIIGYQVAMLFKGYIIDRKAVSTLCSWLWLFTIVAVSLEMLEIITLAYEKAHEWEVVKPLLAGPLAFSWLGLQVIAGSLIPLIILGVIVLLDKHMDDTLTFTLSIFASLLLLVQVFSMRWNVVVGGQLISKSFSGLRQSYHPTLFGREGILMACIVLVIPIVIIVVAERIVPMFKYSEEQTRRLQETSAQK
jgi:Ni/Fe-hydrogenase subunit HybB-like protein